MEKTIEIPEGYEARIDGNKVILERKDERVRKEIISFIKEFEKDHYRCIDFSSWIAYLERLKEQNEIFDVDKFFAGKDVTDFKKELFFLIRGARELKPTDEEIWLNIENQIANNLIDILQEDQKPLPQANSEARYYFDEWIKRQPIPKYWNAFLAGIDFNKKQQQPAEWSDSVAKEMFIKALERAVEQTKKGYELTDCDKHSWWEDFKAYSGIKPAELSEEDELKRNNLIGLVEEIKRQPLKKLEDWDGYINFLKSLPKRFNLQPRQEWSKEDEETLACAISVFEDFAECKNVSVPPAESKRYLKRLKSLRPQSKQEWSEEDKLHLNNAILAAEKEWGTGSYTVKFLKSFSERFNLQPKQEWREEDEMTINELCNIIAANAKNGYLGGHYAPDLVSKLKSLLLHLHWKPSEEQMEALFTCTSVGSFRHRAALKSLYNDLKKL